VACGLLGASAVAIGAIASHVMTNPAAIASVEKASSYQLWHVLAILVSLLLRGPTVTYARTVFTWLASSCSVAQSMPSTLQGYRLLVVVAPAGG